MPRTGSGDGQAVQGISIELRRLRAEHHKLACLSDAILGLIASPTADMMERLQPYWQEYRTILIRHLKCEDWILYPRLQSSADSELAAMAAGLFHEVGGLSAQLERFDAMWTDEARRNDWQGYARDMCSILALVDHRSEHEEQKLFPMAASRDSGQGEMRPMGQSIGHVVPERRARPARGMPLGVDLIPRLA